MVGLLDLDPFGDFHTAESARRERLNFGRAEGAAVDSYVVDLADEVVSGLTVSMRADHGLGALPGVRNRHRGADGCDLVAVDIKLAVILIIAENGCVMVPAG